MGIQSLNLNGGSFPAAEEFAGIRKRWKDASTYVADNKKKVSIYGLLGGALAFDMAFGGYNLAHGVTNSLTHMKLDLDSLSAGGAGVLGAYKCVVAASITKHAGEQTEVPPTGPRPQTLWQKAHAAVCSPQAHEFLIKSAPYMAPVFAALTVMNLNHGHHYFALMNTGNTCLYANARTVARVAGRFLSQHLG